MTLGNQYQTKNEIDLNAQTTTSRDLKAKIDNLVAKSFMWMGVILLVTFGVAFYTYSLLISNTIQIGMISTLSRIGILGGFGLVVLLSYKWQSMSYGVFAGLLILFGVLEGFGLSYIFIMYEMTSIINVFALTSGLFFVLSIAGYYLKFDVTKFGSILFAGLIMIIISQLINIFVGSNVFNLWISIFGVVIFCGMIIYDMGVIKEAALIPDNKTELFMALQLFLSFINLFLFLLRIFGGSKD